jgi:hypothetical protein
MKIIICIFIGFILGKIDLDKKLIPVYKDIVHSQPAKDIQKKVFLNE